MADKYVFSTKGVSDVSLNLGDVVYAKKCNKTRTVQIYKKDGIPGVDPIGNYITTIRGTKQFVDKFDMPANKRKAYIVCDMDETNYVTEFLYQEDDTKEPEPETALYKNLLYRKEGNKAVITGFVSKNPKIVIPESIDDLEVFAIGNMDTDGLCRPLEMNDNISYKVILPKTVREIYPFAFMNKNVSIEFDDALYYIGEKAFYGCRINSVDLSTTEVDTIERECFACSKLKEIKLPRDLISIKKAAFKYSEVKAVEFNSDVELIEEDAFYDCNLDTNRATVDRLEKNAFTCETPSLKKKCEYINYYDIKYTVLGHVKYLDYIKDKILEDVYIDEECYCLKQVFFAKDGDKKYEIVIEYDEEYGNEDLWLEYIKYINSVRVKLYKVDEFDIARHFETYIPDYDEIRISGRFEEGEINIKNDENGKIVGVKLNERHRYNYEDWVYNEFNSGDFSKTNKFLALNLVFGQKEDEFMLSGNDEIVYNEIKEEYNKFIDVK